MFVSHRLKSVFAAALLLFSFIAGGALPPPERLQALLTAATPQKYPNADTVTVYDGEYVVYRPDGLYDETNEFCIKALTEAGRKGLRRLSFNYNGNYGEYSVAAASIVKPDGKRIAVDLGKNVSVAISTRSMACGCLYDVVAVCKLGHLRVERRYKIFAAHAWDYADNVLHSDGAYYQIAAVQMRSVRKLHGGIKNTYPETFSVAAQCVGGG